MLTELVSYLDLPDDDYWYDSACDIARNFINRNEEEVFALLLSEWIKWPVSRQEHLAYLLGEGDSDQELALINKMLLSKNENVVFRAKEALIDFNQNDKSRK